MSSRKTKKARANQVIPRRINILFGMILFLFAILVGRLAYMQIVHHTFYKAKLETASQKVVTISSVRGGIFDASGKPLVQNRIKQVVSYTRSNQATAADIKKVAQQLAEYVTISEVKTTDRDRVDYYIADQEVYAKVVAELPRKDRVDESGNLLPEATIYNHAADSVDVASLQMTPKDDKAAYLFTQMNSTGFFETKHLITDELTPEQIATIAAHEDQLQGVSTASGWDRQVMPTSLSSIIGTVTTDEVGLPEDLAEEYLKKGYSMKDRVGTAYLEKAYEDVLQGQHEKREINLDKNGQVDSIKTIQDGVKGKNIKLTIDLKFQDGVNEILRRYLQNEVNKGTATYTPGAYAVVLKPEDGSVLAMAGYKHEEGSPTIQENSLGVITDTFTPGSIVKAATITAGWQDKVISGDQKLNDQVIQFGKSKPILSWFTAYLEGKPFPLDVKTALAYSSNTYMVQIALKLIGEDYEAGMLLPEDSSEGMEKLRATFAQYGLGASTGIDLPAESLGFIPSSYSTADYINESFGQFDNYTPMQMAQYVATIANGGKRIAPHVVQGIYDNTATGELGDQLQAIQGKEMNQVDISPENLKLLQEGFYEVVHGQDSYTTGKELSYGTTVSLSAKTGTAETYAVAADGSVVTTVNTNIVAYAPSKQPKIAISVVLPQLTDLNSTTSKEIVKEISNLYFNLYGNS